MYKVKKDKYLSSRGGGAILYKIFCRKCDALQFVYQKDGKGALYRLYVDRIYKTYAFDLATNKVLHCGKCKRVLAYKMVYKKESRLAFRLFADSIYKRRLA